jgi:hypothetical protein
MQPLQATTMLYSLRMQLPVLHSLSFSVFNTRSWLKAQDMLGELGRFTQLKQLRLYLQNTQVSRPQQQKYVYDLLPLGGGLDHVRCSTIH